MSTNVGGGEPVAGEPQAPIEPDGSVLEPEPPAAGVASRFRRLLLAGLVVLVPVALTAYVLQQLFLLLDGIFSPLVTRAAGSHIPGIGLLLTLLVVLVLGWLSTNVLGRRLIDLGERLLQRIPVGRSIYSATKSVLQVFAHRQTDAFKRVVLIEYPRKGMFSVAFVTGRVRWPQLHDDLADARLVFLPTSPNPTSGYLLAVPTEDIIDLPIPVEEGVRLVISGGLLLPQLPGSPGSIPFPAPPPAADGGGASR